MKTRQIMQLRKTDKCCFYNNQRRNRRLRIQSEVPEDQPAGDIGPHQIAQNLSTIKRPDNGKMNLVGRRRI